MSRIGQRAACERQLQGRGKRCAAPARNARKAALGLDQRTGRRQDQLGLRPAKGQQRHMVAAGIGGGKQQFDGTLGLGQSGKGGGA